MDRSNPLKNKPSLKAAAYGDDTMMVKKETPPEEEEETSDTDMKEIDDFLNSGEEEGKGKLAIAALPNLHCYRKPRRARPEVKPSHGLAESEELCSRDFYYEHCYLNLDQDGDRNDRLSMSPVIYFPKNLLPTPYPNFQHLSSTTSCPVYYYYCFCLLYLHPVLPTPLPGARLRSCILCDSLLTWSC